MWFNGELGGARLNVGLDYLRGLFKLEFIL